MGSKKIYRIRFSAWPPNKEGQKEWRGNYTWQVIGPSMMAALTMVQQSSEGEGHKYRDVEVHYVEYLGEVTLEA